MRRFVIAAIMLVEVFLLGAPCVSAQSMDDMNLQVHGYVTQGFVYSTNNNWSTTNSTDGSPAWTEAVVNLTAQPTPKLRVAVQSRYFLLGDYGNQITLDFASADYKVNEKIGFRVGKVKSPTGLLNESQDIDPAQLWILLPQSIYPLSSRSSTLAHFGAVVYGRIVLGESLGQVEYRAYGGERVVPADDGFLQGFREHGSTLPNGMTTQVYGGTLHWNTPIHGLMLGATEGTENFSALMTTALGSGKITGAPFNVPYFFTRFERNKLMVAAEYARRAPHSLIQITSLPSFPVGLDQRSFFIMASYKITRKMTSGVYYSSALDRTTEVGSGRFQKDWALSARYDVNPFLYAKFEQHWMDGTLLGYSSSNNSDGLQPNARMTLLKLGVTF